jgi:hypothetical protein
MSQTSSPDHVTSLPSPRHQERALVSQTLKALFFILILIALPFYLACIVIIVTFYLKYLGTVSQVQNAPTPSSANFMRLTALDTRDVMAYQILNAFGLFQAFVTVPTVFYLGIEIFDDLISDYAHNSVYKFAFVPPFPSVHSSKPSILFSSFFPLTPLPPSRFLRLPKYQKNKAPNAEG